MVRVWVTGRFEKGPPTLPIAVTALVGETVMPPVVRVFTTWVPVLSGSSHVFRPVAAVPPPSAALDQFKATLARVAAGPTAEVAVTPLPLTR